MVAAKHNEAKSLKLPSFGNDGRMRTDPLESIGRLERLRAEFLANAARLPKSADVSLTMLARQAAAFSRSHARFSKVAIGLAILIVVGWLPVRSFFQATSTEAVVNAALITLRAPIDGQIELMSAAPHAGDRLAPEQAVMRIVNRRADRSRIDDLRRLIDQLGSEREGFATRLAELIAFHGDLAAQVKSFQEGRTRQLTERVKELTSELAAAGVSRDAAAKALERVSPMAESGSVSQAVMEKYTRDAKVTVETYKAIQHRLEALKVELQATVEGTFLGDTYNDRPRSSQRLDEVAQRIGEVTADLREREARLAGLRSEFAEESKRYRDNSEAVVASPVAGRIWEMLTAPGEAVLRGQDLARLLDCSTAVITAAVSEAVYNGLRIGQSATFDLRGNKGTHTGRIVGLTGVASAPANLAIQPNALAKEMYRVTVALDQRDADGDCRIGRTGRVTFKE